MATLQELIRTRDAKLAEANAIYDAIGDESPPAETVEKVSTINKEVETLDHQIKESREWADARAALAARAAAAREPERTLPFPAAAASGDSNAAAVAEIGRLMTRHAEEIKSVGMRFIESKAFKDWYQQVSLNGHVSEKQQLQSPAFQVKTLVTGASVTSGGATIIPGQYPGLVQLPLRPLVMKDVITRGNTGSDSVEFVRVTSLTNNASMVAESTATANPGTMTAPFGVKPESALALERVTAAVKAVAHWIPATTRALSDAGQLRTLIDGFLYDGLEQVLETQMITGDGTGDNLLGILNTPGTTAQAFVTDKLTTTRKARTKVRTVGRAVPTGYVMHPNDWEALDLTTDNEARYFFGGPTVLGMPRLWGLPVVESEAMSEGTSLVGDMKTAILWDREQASIQVSNQHADFFIRNLIAILAEMRVAFGLLRPAAITVATLA